MEYKIGQNVFLTLNGKKSNTIWNIVGIEGNRYKLLSEYGAEEYACEEDLKPAYCALTQEQRQAVEELTAAFQKCKDLDIKIAYDHFYDVMFTLNGRNVADCMYRDCYNGDNPYKNIDEVNGMIVNTKIDYAFDGNDDYEFDIIFEYD